MNAQVSLGSQPQYLPQAFSAQIAPAITEKVHTGKEKAMILLVKVRNFSALGIAAIGPVKARPRDSIRDCTSESPAEDAATVNAPAQMMAAETWMTNQ